MGEKRARRKREKKTDRWRNKGDDDEEQFGS